MARHVDTPGSSKSRSSRANGGRPRGGMTKQELVYRKLRERVLSGVYGPGYRLVIDGIAKEMEVSALPVREAIRRLETEGLVVYRANAGAQVAPADPNEYDSQLTILAVLEGYATALASKRLEREDLDRLSEITDEMQSAMERLDTLRFGRLNQEFHAVVYERCPNAALVEMLRDVSRRLDAIRRTVFVHIPYRGAASIAEHRQLIELLRQGAPADEIEGAARRHKLATVESFHEWQRTHDKSAAED